MRIGEGFTGGERSSQRGYAMAALLVSVGVLLVLMSVAMPVWRTQAQRENVLPAIAEGRLKLAFAHGERDARHDLARVACTARKSGAAYRIDGEKQLAMHAPSADQLIVSARTAGGPTDARGISLFLVDAKAPGIAWKSC